MWQELDIGERWGGGWKRKGKENEGKEEEEREKDVDYWEQWKENKKETNIGMNRDKKKNNSYVTGKKEWKEMRNQ